MRAQPSEDVASREEGETPAAYVTSDDVLTAELEEEAVLLHMGTKRYYRLNETGSWIWSRLQEGLGRQQLIRRLRERFRVDCADAEHELDEFVARLEENGLVESLPGSGAEGRLGDSCHDTREG